jgi:hypothetical protein
MRVAAGFYSDFTDDPALEEEDTSSKQNKLVSLGNYTPHVIRYGCKKAYMYT